MGRKARMQPKRLAEKLLLIRQKLGLSQSEMLRCLGFEEEMDYRRISEFERGTTEPHLLVVLRYARAAGIRMEDIVDDAINLPSKLRPVSSTKFSRSHSVKSSGSRRRPKS